MPYMAMRSLLLASLLVCGGCAGQPGPPASAAEVVLNDAQAATIRRSLNDAVPLEAGPPLVVRPASGLRWTDVEHAVHSAGQAPTVAYAVVSADVGAHSGILRLRTAEGWPVVVRATNGAEGIGFNVVVGPYPNDAAAQAHAITIERAIVQAMEAWGRRRLVPKADPAGMLTP